MLDFNTCTQEDILKQANQYIDRLNKLMEKISTYMNKPNDLLKEDIKKEYKQLKTEFKEQYNLFDAEFYSNKKTTKEIPQIHKDYKEAIMSAYAHNFNSRTDGAVNQNLYNSITDIEFDLNFYLSKYKNK